MAEAYPSTSSEPTAEESAKNRIVKAEEYKQAGNILYKEKSYKMAIGKYHRALLQVRDIDNQRPKPLLKGLMGLAGEGNNVFKQDKNLTNEMTQQVKQLELSCYNNLAACLLHDIDPNYEKIIQYCGEVLKRDSKNPKAWYRQGVALYHTQEYKEAQNCLNKAKRSMPRGM
ncbi:putative tetratricopeptide repeat protein 9C-like [Apostichopus japonicus]|uniref:Putative tetratricopeptide repeat protein 9C-like n=1 Tax=Stichopus japonicus TaxID=307972 RepID=A0A2G8JSP7_STIJA|nr:putative tetratricopeptide repeat protein 9C-like [Apostichopus japonicus]